MFVIVLAVIYFILGMDFSAANWIGFAFGLKGLGFKILGADHTWFVTALLFCYLFTPAISRAAAWLERNKEILPFVTTALCTVPFLLAWVPLEFVSTLLSPVVWYALAYMLGRHFKRIPKNKKCAAMAVVIMCAVLGIRLAAQGFLDGTIWYDRITIMYTSAIAAFCIFYLFAWFFEKKAPPKSVQILSEISFEVYLYHYMFCVGPLKLFGSTPLWVTDCLLVTAVAVLIAFVMNRLSKKVTERFERKIKS